MCHNEWLIPKPFFCCSTNTPANPRLRAMRLLPFRGLWGVMTADGGPLTLQAAAAAAAASGAVGIECSVALAFRLDAGSGAFQRALVDHGLLWSPSTFTSGPVWRGWDPFPRGTPRAGHGDAPPAHAAALAGQLAAAADLCPSALFREAVVLAGHDSKPTAENAETIGRCLDSAAAAGVACAFETHRGRALATPWAWAALTRELGVASAPPAVATAALPLCLDVAHWTVACEVACEGDDDDFDATLAAAAVTAVRLQARVGSDQASQVDDPTSSDAAPAVALAVGAWRRAVEGARARGAASFIATPEFGPAPYLREGGKSDWSVARLNEWAAAEVARVAGKRPRE